MWETVLALVVGAALAFYFYRRRHLSLFKRIGIPGPEPNFLFGNFLDLADSSTRHERFVEWHEKFGDVYGVWYSAVPCVVISDVEILRQVLIKQFHQFHGKMRLPLRNRNEDPRCDLFSAEGAKWKRLRNISNPAFATGKMRQLGPIMESCVSTFLSQLEAETAEGGTHDLYDRLQCVTLEIIAETGFGMSLGSIENRRSNPVLGRMREIFNIVHDLPWHAMLDFVIPELDPILYKYDVFISERGYHGFRTAGNYLANKVIQPEVEKRRSGEIKRADLLQSLVEAELDPTGGEQVSSGINLDEMKALSIIFLIAGYETSSNTLAFCILELCKHPDIQEKVYEEVVATGGSFDYDTLLNKMSLTERVLLETLRLYPIAESAVIRRSTEPVSIGGFLLPADMGIQVNVRVLHYNASFWGPEEVNEFCPDRFLPDRVAARDPLAFQAFGSGPRTCIGMRMALYEMKLILHRLLSIYRLELGEGALPIRCKTGFTLNPSSPIAVKLQRRV